MRVTNASTPLRALIIVFALLLTTAACTTKEQTSGLDPDRQAMAFQAAQKLRAAGQRVWCVPYARNVSGIEIRGNARTWWAQAQDKFGRGHEPQVGAVMAFSGTSKLPLGHVTVVSGVIDSRNIVVHHANWHRNKISQNMAVVDVSDKNDWSAVRVESYEGNFGRVYPVDGFIYPDYEG